MIFDRDTIFFWFFFSHIWVTIFIDLSIINKGKTFHPKLHQLINWHVRENNDYLVGERPKYLQFFVYTELFFQLPFFIASISYGVFNLPRNIVIFYGLLAGGSTILCMIDIVLFGHKPYTTKPLNFKEKLMLLSFYLPYAGMPLILLLLI